MEKMLNIAQCVIEWPLQVQFFSARQQVRPELILCITEVSQQAIQVKQISQAMVKFTFMK